MSNIDAEGYVLRKGAFQEFEIIQIQDELLKMGNALGASVNFKNLDDLWNFYKISDRNRASAIYNGFKYLPSIRRIATSESMHEHLRFFCGIQFPALVDINCRIDSFGEEKYLFDWHQDYWFSVCSPNAIVVWLPVMRLTPAVGGLQIIANNHTGGRILKTKRGYQYRSYADAVLLDEEIPEAPVVAVDDMSLGDALFFKFNILHKSIPVQSRECSRFTVQLRYADYFDADFVGANYRPGSVAPKVIDYLNKEKR